MSEWNFELEGGSSLKLTTKGKYCDRDILIKSLGGGGEAVTAPILDSLYPIVLDKETGTYTPSYTDIMETFTAMAEGTGTLMPAIDWSEWEGSGGNDLSYGDNARLPSFLLGVATKDSSSPSSLIFGHAIQDGGNYVYLHYDNTFEIKTAGTNMIGCSLREEFGYNEVTSAEQYDRIYDAIKKGQQVHISPSYYDDFVPFSYSATLFDIENLEEDPGVMAFVGPLYGDDIIQVVGLIKGQEPQHRMYYSEDRIVYVQDITNYDPAVHNAYGPVTGNLVEAYSLSALKDSDKTYLQFSYYDNASLDPIVYGHYDKSNDAVEVCKLEEDGTLTFKTVSFNE